MNLPAFRRPSPTAARTVAPLTACLSILLLGACAGIAPTADEMAKVPVVRFGQPAPADGNFVLHYPAGAKLPVVASVKGSLLSRTDEKTLEVSPARDIYVYRQWVSFDGRTWQAGDAATVNRFEVELPGKDGTGPGRLSATFDAK